MTEEELAEEYATENYELCIYDAVKGWTNDFEARKQAFLAGYNKANEWYFVKDRLPPIKKEYNGRSELVLVLSKEKEMQYAQYVEKEKTWVRGIFEINFKPYVWKEIVLPELPKD